MGGHMRVNLRRSQAAMPKKLLHTAYVRAVVEQVGRKAVTQSVRAGAGVQPRLCQILLQ